MIGIFIKQEEEYSAPLAYILKILAKNLQISIRFVENKNDAQIICDHGDPASVPVHRALYISLIRESKYEHSQYLKTSDCVIRMADDTPDWLGTAFYMINAFQEYATESEDSQYDRYGRYTYESTYQYKYDRIEDNIVDRCFRAFCQDVPVLREYGDRQRKSRVFLSHDIDTIHGSFLQDGLWALKHGRVDVIMKLIMNTMLLRPDWRNMDRIVSLHNEHDLTSTFFWLATKKIGANKVKNADYNIRKLKGLTDITRSNGLHKSCYHTSMREEMDMLPFETRLNRYHFLKFNIPSAWKVLQESGIDLDASLGFAERIGFRNNYGLPFRPYNVATGAAFDFVEVPLNVMDGTLHRYMHVPLHNTASRVIEFIEKNKWNSVISVLWHNTYFTDYKYAGYLQEYKKILQYLVESEMRSITPQEIVKEYGEG